MAVLSWDNRRRFKSSKLPFILNLLVFLLCVLILPALGGTRKGICYSVVIGPNPVVMEEATYMWTRVMPVFFIVMALSLYRDGLRKNDSFVHLFGLSGRLNRLNQVRKPIVKRAREIGPVTV